MTGVQRIGRVGGGLPFGPAGACGAVAFSPDGRRVAAATRKDSANRVDVFELPAGYPVASVEAPPVLALRFKNADRLVFASAREGVFRYDLSTQVRRLLCAPEPGREWAQVVLSTSGRWALAASRPPGSTDGELLRFDLEAEDPRPEPFCRVQGEFHLALSGDGQYAIVSDGTGLVWRQNAGTAKRPWELAHDMGRVPHVALAGTEAWASVPGLLYRLRAADGVLAGTANRDPVHVSVAADGAQALVRVLGDVELWRLPDCSRKEQLYREADHESVALSADGRFAAAGGNGLKVWTTAPVGRIDPPHRDRPAAVAVAVSPDSALVAVNAAGTLWYGALNQPDAELHNTRVASRGTGASVGYSISAWDDNWTTWLSSGLAWHSGRAWIATAKGVTGVRVADGELSEIPLRAGVAPLASFGDLLAFAVVARVGVLDLADGKVRHVLKGHAETCMRWVADTDNRGTDIKVPSYVRSLDFAADGRLASAGDDCSIRLWDVGAGVELACFKVPGSVVKWVGTSALVVGNYHGVWLIDSASGSQRWKVSGRAQMTPHDLAVSPDRRLIAVVWPTGEVALLDAEGGDAGRVPVDEAGEFATSVAFLPRGDGLVVGTRTGQVLQFSL